MRKLLSLVVAVVASVACAEPLKVALYVDAGARGGGVVKWLTLLERSREIDVTPVDAKMIRNGALDAADILVMPGGKSTDEANRLGTNGCARLTAFLRRGGGYVGTCAGCFLLTQKSASHPTTFGLLPFTSDAYSGHADLDILFSERSEELTKLPKGTYNLRYSSGPVIYPTNLVTEASGELIATYAEDVAQKKGKVKRPMKGGGAAAVGTLGKGRIYVTCLHPEYDDKDKEVLYSAFRYVSGREVSWTMPTNRADCVSVGVLMDNSIGVAGAREVQALLRSGRANVVPFYGKSIKEDSFKGIDVLVMSCDIECNAAKFPFGKKGAISKAYLAKGGKLVAWGPSAPRVSKLGKGVVVQPTAKAAFEYALQRK